MKSITFKYTLTEEQIITIAKGLGYSDTMTEVTPETGEWTSRPSDILPENYITDQLSQRIEAIITPIFLKETEEKLNAQKEAVESQVHNIINSQKEVTVEDVPTPSARTTGFLSTIGIGK